ncbi:hypothetical protein RF55_12005 [Lasius niger]|uniref:Uncharacterized protein n=1 Tax=Lasius niger TaxID=67767 RepID=A0A0J7KE47_LASNI|nr:hypothetical protein RF55_12005 [Lasius niger]
MEVENRVDSDHYPIVAWIRGEVKGEENSREMNRVARRGIWNEKGRVEFRKKMGRLEGEVDGVQKEIGRVTKIIRKTIEDCEKGIRKEREQKGLVG